MNRHSVCGVWRLAVRGVPSMSATRLTASWWGISAGAIWPLTAGERHGLRLAGLLEEDSALFCRYTAVR